MHQSPARAFTLIETLVVVAIVALIAGAFVMSTSATAAGAGTDLAKHELAQVRDAILRFHADTGWLPGQGPFDLYLDEDHEDPRLHGRVTPLEIQARFAVPAADVVSWFDSAANLWQLVENPLTTLDELDTEHALARWDPDRGRGWRGPYLSLSGEGRVEAGFVNRRLDPYFEDADGDGDASNDNPTGETLHDGLFATRLPSAPAIADPFLGPCGAGTQQLVWTDAATLSPLASQGTPYLLILPEDPTLADRARLISLGPDRRLDPHPDLDPDAPRDDVVLYLFR